jgi:putative ABC transport system permease protein
MLTLAFRNLARRPLRSFLTALGLCVAVAVLGCLSAFGEGYRRALGTELDRMGMQMMLVPLGCPYDAAARVLKGRTLENSLPQGALDEARRDPAVAVAAPMLLAALPRPDEGRTDLWAGIDPTALLLKPWWRVKEGGQWFRDRDSVILGAEAAAVELRAPGDRFYSPETGRTLRVDAVLERSGTSDDSLFFVPLETAQAMFGQPGRLTAVAIRLKDPALLPEVSERLQRVRGAQVVTLTEMMGAFLNLVGAVRTLLLGIAAVALAASALSIFNTLLGTVLEQTRELSLMRALGASRSQIFGLVTLEAGMLALLGSLSGLVLAAGAGRLFEAVVKQFVPLAPPESLLSLSVSVSLQCLAVGVGIGLLAGLYPAWQASRLHPALAMGSE